jgi:hypothetical protein
MATLEEREALRQSLAEHKRELRAAVHEVGEAARAWTDLGDFVRQSPGTWLIGGLVVGLWLGGRRNHHG